MAIAVAPRFDPPAMQRDEATHDREAEAKAAGSAIDVLALLDEQIEHAGKHLWCDAAAGVGDRDDRGVSVSPRGHADAATGVGVLRGVREEVREDLGEPRFV